MRTNILVMFLVVMGLLVVVGGGEAKAACGSYPSSWGSWKSGLASLDDAGNTVYHETLFRQSTAQAGCGASSVWWGIYASTYVLRGGSGVNYYRLYADVDMYSRCGADPYGYYYGTAAVEKYGTYIAHTSVAESPAKGCTFSSAGSRQEKATHKFQRNSGDWIYGTRYYTWYL